MRGTIQRDGVDGVGGAIETIGDTRIAKAIAIGMSSPLGVGNSLFRTTSGKSMLADTVPFPAYTREIVERAGLCDEELVRNQDDEYNYRIREGVDSLADDVLDVFQSHVLRASGAGIVSTATGRCASCETPRQMSRASSHRPPCVALLAPLAFTFLSPPSP
jgi:hypothetical protein